MPALAYRRIREPSLQNSNPVKLGRGKAVQTSDQVKEYMLCFPCEQRFSAAEAYVAPLVRQPDGSSGLEAMLSNYEATPYGWHTAKATDLDRAKVFYFAASVFWRSHASHLPDRCELGAKYGEAFRAFLNEETQRPADAAIMLMVYERAPAAAGRVDRLLTLPASRRADRYHRHQFLMCGLRFDAAVGAEVPDSLHAGCLLQPHETRILVVPQSDDTANVLALLRSSRPTDRLAATLLK